MAVNSAVGTQPFHLPLTLDMDGCGWRGTHLSDSLSLSLFYTLSLLLSHAHFCLILTRHPSLPDSLQATTSIPLWEASAPWPPLSTNTRFSVQSKASCSHWLVPLPHSQILSFSVQSDISCCCVQTALIGLHEEAAALTVQISYCSGMMSFGTLNFLVTPGTFAAK